MTTETTDQVETTLPETSQAEPPETEKPAGESAEKQEVEDKPAEQKRERSPEEREIRRLQRRVDNLTKRLYQGQQPLQQQAIERTNEASAEDSDSLTLSRAELQRMIDQRAKELAPTISQQQAEIEHRAKVVQSLSATWGQQRFDELASTLDDAFEGLADRSGKPKPATEAIFEAEDPAALIEYLADPDHAEEAEALGRMNAIRAGMKVAQLAASLKAQKAQAKPQPSKAPPPVEEIRGQGRVTNSLPSDSDPIDVWVKKERARLAKGK